MARTKTETGLRQRHGNQCRKKDRCNCPWEASVYSKRDGKKIRKQFPTLTGAKAWRQDAAGQVRRNELRAAVPITLADAADQWLNGARKGVIRNRSGHVYKPSAIRSYEAALRLRIIPELGRAKLGAITRTDVQDLVDALVASGLSASAVGTTVLPLRAIYKRAISRNEVSVNPMVGVTLPAVRSGRDRIAAPVECESLLEALPDSERPLWATAMYAGLRRGELQALRIEDIDMAAGVIHVRRGWDSKAGEIDVKSRKPRRVPIAAALRSHLARHLLSLGWHEGLVFGSTPSDPFSPNTVHSRAMGAWGWKRNRKAGETWVKGREDALTPIGLHECRHTYASIMIAADVNAKALSTYMGHANIQTTYNLYGKLMPGNEGEAAALQDAFLARASQAPSRASFAPVVS